MKRHHSYALALLWVRVFTARAAKQLNSWLPFYLFFYFFKECSLETLVHRGLSAFFSFHPSRLFPLSALPPALLLPGCRTRVISPPVVPLALERHKRLRWRYQQQPLWLTSTSPFLSTACRITVSTSFAPRTLNYPRELFFFSSPKAHINIWSVSVGHLYLVSLLLFVFNQHFYPLCNQGWNGAFAAHTWNVYDYISNLPLKPFRIFPPRKYSRCSRIETRLCCEIRPSIQSVPQKQPHLL